MQNRRRSVPATGQRAKYQSDRPGRTRSPAVLGPDDTGRVAIDVAVFAASRLAQIRRLDRRLNDFRMHRRRPGRGLDAPGGHDAFARDPGTGARRRGSGHHGDDRRARGALRRRLGGPGAVRLGERGVRRRVRHGPRNRALGRAARPGLDLRRHRRRRLYEQGAQLTRGVDARARAPSAARLRHARRVGRGRPPGEWIRSPPAPEHEGAQRDHPRRHGRRHACRTAGEAPRARHRRAGRITFTRPRR